MPYRNVYTSEEEDKHIRKQGKGYVRRLVQEDIDGTKRDKALARDKRILKQHPPFIVDSDTGKKPVDKTPDNQEYRNNFLCKKCGSVKVAGKCINKHV